MRTARAISLASLLSATLVGTAAAQDTQSTGLRALATHHGLLIGTAIRLRPTFDDPLYLPVLASEFDIVTPENELKWEYIHPSRGTYRFEQADVLVAIARANGMKVHGHTLVWHHQNPSWLTSGTRSRNELIEVLRDHIITVVGRYRGQVDLWDVVNEPVETRQGVDGYGKLRESVWSTGIGPDFIELAFRFAHQADPSARLIYNHAGVQDSPSATNLAIIRSLVQRGVPIHGVGFEMHVRLDDEPAFEHIPRLASLMNELAALGLDIYITEMDVAIREPATPRKLADQARVYEAVLSTCLDEPACKGFQTWGFTDKYTWVSDHLPGFTAPLLFDESYFPKSAYIAIRDRLRAPPAPRARAR